MPASKESKIYLMEQIKKGKLSLYNPKENYLISKIRLNKRIRKVKIYVKAAHSFKDKRVLKFREGELQGLNYCKGRYIPIMEKYIEDDKK